MLLRAFVILTNS